MYTFISCYTETRGFDYKEKSYDYGLDYYYTKSIGGDLSKVKKIAFTSLLIEYGYIKTKMEMSNNLTLWQQEFLGFFEDKYINNAEEKFKFNGIPIAVLYEQIYSETSLLIKQIMERVKDNKIDEMVISMDDYVIPAFIEKYKKEVWVDKEADGNVVK